MTPLLERMSPAYLQQQRELHASPDGYGGKGAHWAPPVHALILQYGATSVLDYGAGEGSLVRMLRARPLPAAVSFAEYDPAMTGLDHPPLCADLVTVTDVLEHVEPDRLAAVLEHVRTLTRAAAFFVIALGPANKWLSDGRNAHLIQEPPEWWRPRLEVAGFRLSTSDHLPYHPKYQASQKKRWIVIGEPV